MDERQIIEVVGQVMVYDAGAKQWHPAGSSSGLSTVRLIQCFRDNTFRIHGQKINEDKEVVLNSQITREVKYNRANEAFIQWHDSKAFWGLNFRRGSSDAENFFASVLQVLRILNQNATQQQQQQQHQPNMLSPDVSNPQMTVIHQQQQQPTQNSAAIIQRPIIQQQMMQQPQQTLLQQQTQLLNQHQPQAQPNQMMQTTSQPHLIQQQQQQQQHQQQQQQQLHQHYMHHQQPTQVTQPPQQTNHNKVNMYQTQAASQQQPQPQQLAQQSSQQPMQHQAAPVVAAAPVPPPPPPPPAPPTAALGVPRLNGTGIAGNGLQANGSSNQQLPPLTSNNNYSNETIARNGGSPNQAVTSLASELAKCQLKKVNLSRSDSDKQSECNNNNIPNAKTSRAASLAYAPDNLMNDLNKKLASRRERLDQQGDSQSGTNSNNNGISNDKGQESWLADLIRKEISKEITKMKAEIIDAIRTELRQR